MAISGAAGVPISAGDALDAGEPMAKHQGGDVLPPPNDAAWSKLEPGRATRTSAANSK